MWEEVATVPNEPLALLLQELLEAEGIPVLLQPLGAGSMYPAGPAGWRVMVPEDQAQAARDLLAVQDGTWHETRDEAWDESGAGPREAEGTEDGTRGGSPS